MGVRSLVQHANICPSTEHPWLRRRDKHRRYPWVLETSPLHGIIELNIDTESIGIELQLIPRHQRRVFLDVHSQRGDPPLDAQLPVLVASWMRGEIDVGFPLGHQATSWRARHRHPVPDLSQNTHSLHGTHVAYYNAISLPLRCHCQAHDQVTESVDLDSIIRSDQRH